MTPEIRAQFPILNQVDESGVPLVYFDNAATSLKPLCVVDAVKDYYLNSCANVHRGIHRLSERATQNFEATRTKTQGFLNAPSSDDIIFTSGTTHSFNTVALGWAKHHLSEGDEILLTEMDHHANLVPWHLLQKETGVVLKFIRVDTIGNLVLDNLEEKVTKKTKLASIVMTSNAIGTVNPISEIVSRLKSAQPNMHIALDAAQSVAHGPLDVQALGCSALAFSGHKIFGPTGTGILYLRSDFREEFQPVFGGGDMIKTVALEGSTFASCPSLLEAGTPNIAGFIGLGAALDFVLELGWDTIQKLEQELFEYTSKRFSELDPQLGVTIVGHAPRKIPVFSFVMKGAHPHDIASVMDRYGIALRSGHHCAQPLMAALGVTATARASLSFYNSRSEVDQFMDALVRTKDIIA